MGLAASGAADLTEIWELSTEELLAAGGDSRHTIHDDGRNRYGNSYRPEADLLTLGSCTASTVSTEGFEAAHRLHGWLTALDPPTVARAIDDLHERVRTELVANLAMSRAHAVDVVITPSGTDAELIPLLIGLRPGRPLTSIIVGAAEAGSGTARAAACHHFDTVTPSGRTVRSDDPIDAATAERVHTVRVDVRHADGWARDEDEIDDEVRDLVRSAVGAGHHVLVHVIAHSKTGVHAPSLATVHGLVAEHPDRVDVLIDAAQGRLSRRGLAETLARGYMTSVTPSKFFGGPPFAGAVLVPHRDGREPPAELPAGFADYLTPAMLPRTWDSARASLPDAHNPGVLLRWWAGLAEIRDYYSVPAQLRLEVLRHFQDVTPALIEAADGLELASIPPPLAENDVERLLESKTTVFPFTCRRADGSLLDIDELRVLQRLMRDPLDPARGGLSVELGQPVALGADPATRSVLRIALGARQIIRACVVSASGSTFDERLGALTDDVHRTVDKLETLLRMPAGAGTAAR